MGKERAYLAKPSITSGDQCRASLSGLALLLSMGAASHWPHARSLSPNATKAIGPNPVPTMKVMVMVMVVMAMVMMVMAVMVMVVAVEMTIEKRGLMECMQYEKFASFSNSILHTVTPT
jgi:hypothetical protein